MIKRGGNPYEGFKNDRERLWALMSRDVRIVLVVAIAGLTGLSPSLRAFVTGWFS
jgi:hypothetical protein